MGEWPFRLLALLHARRHRAQERRDDLRFLHQASQTLAELVDYRTTLQRVARLAVPDFADWCTVQIVAPNGVEQVAWAHRDPTRVPAGA